MNISSLDRVILRELAKKVAEAGNDSSQQEKANIWQRHNDLERIRPLILIFPEGSWAELVPYESLRCEGDEAKGIERGFRHKLYYWDHLKDDGVRDAVFRCPLKIKDSGWGVKEDTTKPDKSKGASHYNQVIKEERDIDKISLPEVSVDWEGSREKLTYMRELFGDILEVRQEGVTQFGCTMMDTFAKWRGFDQIFIDLMDRPDWVHEAMERMTLAMLSRLDQLQEQDALSLKTLILSGQPYPP